MRASYVPWSKHPMNLGRGTKVANSILSVHHSSFSFGELLFSYGGCKKKGAKEGSLSLSLHGCCWETGFILAYCGLVVEIQIR